MNIQAINGYSPNKHNSGPKSSLSFGIKTSPEEIINMRNLAYSFLKDDEKVDLLLLRSPINSEDLPKLLVKQGRSTDESCGYYILQHFVDTAKNIKPENEEGHFALVKNEDGSSSLGFKCGDEAISNQIVGNAGASDIITGFDTLLEKFRITFAPKN